MDKICLLYQPSGLGDILFIQKICKYYHNLGYKIILPVVHEFKWLNNYIENVEFISWEDKEKKLSWGDILPDNIKFPKKEYYNSNQESIFTDDFIYINFFRPPHGRTMSVKYDMLGLDYSDWADYLTFNRNKEKEDNLFYNILGLKDDEEFIFVNDNFQTRPYPMKFPYMSKDIPKDKKIVNLELIDGYSIFDWCKVIEKSNGIYMIESSLNYVLESKEMRNNLPKDLNLYSRNNNFWEVDYLFNIPWNYRIL
jgi:hypothetical protein